MISIVHIVGLGRIHFSVQVEIENVVFEIDWNKFVLSIPIQQCLKNEFSFPDQFCCESESCIHHRIRGRNLVVLCTRSLQHCTTNTLCTPVSGPFKDLNIPFSSYPWNCQAPPSGIHSPLAVRYNLPSPAPSGPKFNGNVFTAAPVSRFIFTQSNCFGLLVALTSKWKMSLRKCHTFVPNLRALQQNSSHHSILQNSSHHCIRDNSNHRSRKC